MDLLKYSKFERDMEGIQTMRTLGRNLAWIVKNLKREGPSRARPTNLGSP